MHRVHAQDGGRPGKEVFCLLFPPTCLENPGAKQSSTGLGRAKTPQEEGAVDAGLAEWRQGGSTCYVKAIGERTCLCLFLQVPRIENFLGSKPIFKSSFIRVPEVGPHLPRQCNLQFSLPFSLSLKTAFLFLSPSANSSTRTS